MIEEEVCCCFNQLFVFSMLPISSLIAFYCLMHPEETSSGSDNCDFSKVSDFNGGL